MDDLDDTDRADLIACIHARQSEISDSAAWGALGEEERLASLEGRLKRQRDAAALVES